MAPSPLATTWHSLTSAWTSLYWSRTSTPSARKWTTQTFRKSFCRSSTRWFVCRVWWQKSPEFCGFIESYWVCVFCQVFPSGVSDVNVRLLGSVSRVASLADISKWNVTTVDTLAALMNADNGPWETEKVGAVVPKLSFSHFAIAVSIFWMSCRAKQSSPST